ncbi:hypothetical protein WICPIJ_008525 [Wickerhamomyces pijperi]|uniref:Major facilitator superfamily (MFS) profile domain-containing protein n=1 Tax=Wickerhamomyces pijperi TaxID=599730 RepID=A0A9P8TIN4_WICPI|nr:hypothetical protein WICPIJ_008525 [Wickerhamomyces pijperi]
MSKEQQSEQTVWLPNKPSNSSLQMPNHKDDKDLKDTDESPGNTTETNKETQDEPPYTIFSNSDKWFILSLCTMAAMLSAIGAPIYYPALVIVQDYYHTSSEMANLAVVFYLLAQGISPTFFAGLADTYGRRPVMIVSLLIFIAANVIIPLVNSFTALLVLRIVQSAGISPTVALVNGVLGDITLRQERAGFVGISSGLVVSSQSYGSLLGAGLISGLGWRAIFWFLAIAGFVALTLITVFLPETQRAKVGNGSILPKSKIFSTSPIFSIGFFKKRWHIDQPDMDTLSEAPAKVDFTAGFKILLVPDLAIMLLNQGLQFSLFTITLTTLTTQLSKTYHYPIIKIGLCYLPPGFGGLLGAITSGKLNDWNYRRQMTKFQAGKENGTIPQDKKFDIIRARLQLGIPANIICDLFGIMFGWCIYYEKHIATINVSSFWICFFAMFITANVSTLLVDLYPSKGSGATSIMNFVRCTLGALFVAVLDKMDQKMNIGGTLTFISAICMVSNASLLYPILFGMKNAQKREAAMAQSAIDKS